MKITIYELLGLIKDGKTPKNIKFENYKYTWKIGSSNYFCEQLHQYLTHFIGEDLFLNFNLEVEIIEEEQDIKEISINENGTLGFPNGNWTARNMDKAFAIKINELIKAVNELNNKE